MKDGVVYYSVGALMYCPANNRGIVDKLLKNEFGTKFSLAFCLEDTINDNMVEEAEKILVETLETLNDKKVAGVDFYLPKIFIRVRYPKQISKLLDMMSNEALQNILFGFIAPKFDMSNADDYIQEMQLAENRKQPLYFMPILESDELVSLKTRYSYLYSIYDKVLEIEDFVLNIRVGGNDLSNVFGLRRHSFETVYDIKPVADILVDILTVFSKDFVVSGAVWEYYNGENWNIGLANEVQKDITAGFVGKTVIHPKQIEVFNTACKVLKEDVEDAKAVLNWDKDDFNLVKGSNLKSRMNEYKTHCNWAKRIMYLADYYGIK